jgi:nicotinamidase-related amidase
MPEAANPADWSAFALVLIDVQRDFWPAPIARHFPLLETRITQLLAFCRGAGIEVIHLRASFAADRSDWMAKYKLSGQVPCVRGTAGIAVLPCAAAVPSELVIEKSVFDGFHTPRLLTHLRQRRKRFLLTAGIETSVCVLFTTASAAQLGFLTAVVEDCCADQPDKHAHALSGYPFVFERTTVNALATCHSDWLAKLTTLEPSDGAQA